MAAAGDRDVKVATPDPKQVLKWRTVEVAKFIRNVNPSFDEYVRAFEHDSVTGSMLVSDIDDEWLTAKVKNSLHRKTIAREIATLRSITPPTADFKSPEPELKSGIFSVFTLTPDLPVMDKFAAELREFLAVKLQRGVSAGGELPLDRSVVLQSIKDLFASPYLQPGVVCIVFRRACKLNRCDYT